MTPITITDRNFADQVLGVKQVVIVHFCGRHCPLCGRVAADLQTLAGRLSATVRLATVDVGACRSLVKRLGIIMVPTMIVFVRGAERLRLRGAIPLDELRDAVESLAAEVAATHGNG